jgi:antitoxin HicB
MSQRLKRSDSEVQKITTKVKDVSYYDQLPYNVTIERRDDQGIYYVARITEIPDLFGTGDSGEEALKDLNEVKPEWFETSLQMGHNIPEPINKSKASGKLVLRVPSSLHETLIETAKQEGVSLNQYMVAALARAVGRDEATYAKEKKTVYKTKPTKKI